MITFYNFELWELNFELYDYFFYFELWTLSFELYDYSISILNYIETYF